MTKRRVVITGLGMVSPLGNDVASSWSAALSGLSGIASITHFSTEQFSVSFGGEIKNLDVSLYLQPKDTRKIDRFIQYGLIAAEQAIKDSGLEQLPSIDRQRTGVIIGSGIGGLETIENNHKILYESGPRKMSPFFVPGAVINMLSGNVAIKYGFSGPNFAIASACSSGSHSIGYAARTISYGDADVMVAGGAEVALTPMGLAAFSAARALSTRNESPELASRPWDIDRDGFVLGDGAGVLVLEEYQHARLRGANIYAELAGFGMSDDAFHITSPPEGGVGALVAMSNALKDADLRVHEVDYINAHGTSTVAGDFAECQAIKVLFGKHAESLAISSTKSMTGHLIGAAGAVEAIFSVLSIRDGMVAPTINLQSPDIGCDLNFVPNQAQHIQVDVAMSNSFGFGGTNSSLVFSKLRD